MLRDTINALHEGTLRKGDDVRVWMCREARGRAREATQQRDTTPCDSTECPSISNGEDNHRLIAASHRAFGALSEVQRTVLTRFYLLGESEETICAVEALTPYQFAGITAKARDKMKRAFKRDSAPSFAGCS